MASGAISAVEPDWSREKRNAWWSPAKQLLHSIRSYQRLKNRSGLFCNLLANFQVLRHIFWSTVTGTDIPLNCKIGGGLVMIHPNGIVIHPSSEIGVNCFILQQVTIAGGVKIGGHVDIGAGAKIIRPVTIGDHAQIGANAVVVNDVPAGAIVIGIPARISSQLVPK